MAEYLICNKCKYKNYPKYAYPCAGCKRQNHYRYFTALKNEFIGQCIECGTPYSEGDITLVCDRHYSDKSVLKCVCHNINCRRISMYKIGSYLTPPRGLPID